MVLPFPSFAGVPSGASAVLDLTADMAPGLSVMVFALGLGVIGLAIAAALHDTWWVPRQAKKAADRQESLPKAA
jgi:hypothetical protein